ncbi:MAG: TAXI family TRAP transporter solute-binding subunit, partial [Gallionellaceae bacterium]
KIEKLLKDNPLMSRQAIPSGLYRGYADPVPTVGDRAMLVTSSDVSDEAVRRFVDSLIYNLPELKQSTLELNELDPDKMFSEGIYIPLHSGVASYLKSPKARFKHVEFTSN